MAESDDNPLKGIALTVAGMGCITCNDAMMKLAVAEVPFWQAIFVRGVFALLPIAFLVYRSGGRDALKVNSVAAQAWCALLLALPLFVFIYSLSQLPLSLATIIFFTNPLFVVLIAPVVLGERLNGGRLGAVLLGFAGAMLVMQPDTAAFQWVMLGPVVVAFLSGLRELVIRRVIFTERSESLLLYSSLAVTLCAACTLPFLGWHALEWRHVGLLAIASVGFGFGIFLMTEALRHAEVSLLSPYKYSAVVWALLLGSVFWGEALNPLAMLGTALIVGSGLFVVLRERRGSKP